MAVRIAGKADLKRIDEIEHACFPPEHCLEDGQAAVALKAPMLTCVSTRRRKVIGFTQIHATKNTLQVVNMAVDPKYRRQGVGSEMMRWLKARSPCPEFLAFVYETYLPAQLFLRKNGFTCINTVVGQDNETYYEFSWLRPSSKK
jgi:ribosomal protein S18 acetylase RimI-like enzyme